MRKLLIALVLSVLSSFPALANWTGKDATPATITFYNPGACTSVVCVPVVQITDGTNQVTLTTVGADGVSNTLTGIPVYARNVVWNGTTWDRWTGAVTVASGAIVDGGDVAQGHIADTVCAATGNVTVTGCLRSIAQSAQNGTAANGSAPSASSVGVGGVGSGATGGLQRAQIICDQHAFFDNTTQLTTLVTGVASRKVYVCGFILATGGTATNIGLTSGTGTNCASTSVAITPVYQLAANDRVGANSPTWNGLISLTAADNLCQSASAANSHQVELWYSVQ